MLGTTDFERLVAAVSLVEDPEVPVTLHDLGVLRSVTQDDDVIRVVLRATKIGCPGKSRMTDDIAGVCRAIAPDLRIEIEWDLAQWSPDDVTEVGRGALEEFGIVLSAPEKIECPYCSSHRIEMLSEYGGSICKVPYRCGACGSMFDRLRSIEGVQAVSIGRKSQTDDKER